MNLDIQKIINELRAAGRSDDFVKQILKNAGLSDKAIDEALGAIKPASVPSTPAASVPIVQSAPLSQPISEPAGPVASSNKMSTGKIVAILAGTIIILGGIGAGAYAIFSGNSPMRSGDKQVGLEEGSTKGGDITQTTKGKTAGTSSGNLSCKNLLPDTDFERITGKNISGFKVVEENNDLTKEEGIAAQGLKTLGITGDQYRPGSTYHICSYVPADSYEQYKNYFGSAISAMGDIGVTVLSDGSGNMTDPYNTSHSAAFNKDQYKNVDKSYETQVDGESHQVTYKTNSKGEIEMWVDGKLFTTVPAPQVTAKDLSGIGTSSFEDQGSIMALSSNSKYIIGVITKERTEKDLTIAKEIAKIVDSNLK